MSSFAALRGVQHVILSAAKDLSVRRARPCAALRVTRMIPKCLLFDLAWEDVFAAAHDHLFEAPHDGEVAMRIHHRQLF